MKAIGLFIMVVILTSCCETHNKIEYIFEGTTITRIDKCGISTFKYLDPIDQNRGTIWVEYSGVVSGFSGYLKFKEDGKVQILSSDGYFESKNLDTSKFEYIRLERPGQIPVIGENVCWILNAANVEQERNKRDGSGINIRYDIIE